MFSHVFLGTKDVERAKSFYDQIMKVLGFSEGSGITVGFLAFWLFRQKR